MTEDKVSALQRAHRQAKAELVERLNSMTHAERTDELRRMLVNFAAQGNLAVIELYADIVEQRYKGLLFAEGPQLRDFNAGVLWGLSELMGILLDTVPSKYHEEPESMSYVLASDQANNPMVMGDFQ